MTEEDATTASSRYRIQETGQRVTGLELDLHLFFSIWAVVDRSGDQWVVRTMDGQTLTLIPAES